MDQGSTMKRSAVHNFAPTVTKFCVMWEGQALPHDTKFGNSRCEIVGRRVIFIWSLIHGLRWSGLIKAEPGFTKPNRNWLSQHYNLDMYKLAYLDISRWRHQMETFSALPVSGEFPAQRPVTRSFDGFLWSTPNQTAEETLARLVIWDAIAPIMTSFWCSRLAWTNEWCVFIDTCHFFQQRFIKSPLKLWHV